MSTVGSESARLDPNEAGNFEDVSISTQGPYKPGLTNSRWKSNLPSRVSRAGPVRFWKYQFNALLSRAAHGHILVNSREDAGVQTSTDTDGR